jgi:hypothetical protein
VLVTATDGFRQLQELELVHGFQSSSEPCLIFGLGKREYVTVTIIWKDGTTQTLEHQVPNKTITLDKKNASPVPPIKIKEPAPIFSEMGIQAGIDKKAENAASNPAGNTTGNAAGNTSGNLTGANIPFVHREDPYNDFKREPLLPRQYSRNGPALTVGDVDGDGKIDFFVGGARGQPGAIYTNEGMGGFKELPNPVFAEHSLFEAVDALFADFNKDGFPDLYVVSGGNESDFQDHIYWNDGKGNFGYKPDILPPTASSGGQVVAFDIDGDGDLDIFRTGQVTTGAYPTAPRSYLFRNDKGIFTDMTPDFLQHIGMVSTVKIADINKDGVNDLVLAGEFMPVTILFGQRNAPYFSLENKLVIPNSSGWWNCLKIEDIDDDGDLDIIGGNEGLNGQMKPNPAEPVTIDAADIDNNGSMDAILSYYVQGKSYPVATRDELLDQVPSFKTKFPSYKAYCDATVKDIFTTEQLAGALHLEAVEFRSGVFVNDGGAFHFIPFPNEAQAFPVRSILTGYFTGPVHPGRKRDILLAGNDFAVRAQWGRQDAGKGLLLAQEKGLGQQASELGGGSVKEPEGAASKRLDFSVVPESGFHADRDARKMVQIDNFIIVANNDDKIQLFRIN